MPTIIAIVIALIAVAVAVGAWFRPAPKAETAAPKVYSEQETADAKKAVCDAYEQVSRAISAAGNRDGGIDPTAGLAVATNIRLALSTSSEYLSASLSSEPATPSDLSAAVQDLVSAYRQVALLQIADAAHDDIDPFYRDADRAISKIGDACK